MTQFTPVAIFAYNRLNHLKKTIKYLSQNYLAEKTDIYIFSDGFKEVKDKSKVIKVREFVKRIKGFKSVKLYVRKKNLGLSRNLTNGISFLLKKRKKLIVLEDDLLTDRYFLKYMNDSLNFYKHNKKIISIHAYLYPIKTHNKKPFFLKGADCWGWGTWENKWKIYNKNSESLLKLLISKNKKKEFNFNNSYNYTKMLKDNFKKKNDSWAIRWYASAFLKNKLTLYPPHSLIKNIGNDGSGSNTKSEKKFDIILKNKPIKIEKIIVQENKKVKKEVQNFFNSNLNFFQRIYKFFSFLNL